MFKPVEHPECAALPSREEAMTDMRFLRWLGLC